MTDRLRRLTNIIEGSFTVSAKHEIYSMKKSHDTNHKEWTAQDELDKFRLLLCVNKPRAQMFEKVRLKLYMVGCF